MNRVIIAIAALISTIAISCVKEKEKPKVIYDEGKAAAAKKPDSTQIKVADLPILMDGTKYLIHAVGDIRIYDDTNRSYGSSRANSSASYAISNYNRYEITGYFSNLKFQHVDSTAMTTLTDRKIQIQTATFLNTMLAKRQLLVYTLVDEDTNKDGKMDANDIKSLYISEMGGKSFTKLSSDMQELIDWNIIEAQNRLYFRTIEDINKNGAFDKNDMVHYHFVNLMAEEWKAEGYEPVE